MATSRWTTGVQWDDSQEHVALGAEVKCHHGTFTACKQQEEDWATHFATYEGLEDI